jgi:hypothetical protein
VPLLLLLGCCLLVDATAAIVGAAVEVCSWVTVTGIDATSVCQHLLLLFLCLLPLLLL